MNPHYWTYGAEHELADWPYNDPLPEGYGRDRNDITIVNSNGIANDPSGRTYDRGGEINTPPTKTVTEQVDCLTTIKQLFPMARVNYRSNLHCHVRVPGLFDDLEMLKRVQAYIHKWMPELFDMIVPLPKPIRQEWPSEEEFQGAMRRWRRRRVSHRTLLTPRRLSQQLATTTIGDFFRAESPKNTKTGEPMPHLQPRVCVNLRQLLQTDTVEFRHFPGTLSEDEFLLCLSWCQNFMLLALANQPPVGLARFFGAEFPKFPRYVHWMEVRYRATVHDGTVPRDKIIHNTQLILEGKFPI